ncbi:hypothetical protein MVES1_003979 [Malassezia vespertilionis]|uniref:uncharacterized protein n=1 Tax=Malassezia vespertilionis TaxID=2020962 RepID=UPI0024B2626E|nr:uncharacterized protein MVES1_003979 [Malassezia vespertilionis]WFD08603.1 hypothetical protein MVES1_003979 [Malassezia vespertilionis]
MATYADFFNARYTGERSAGPVRVTIARGDADALEIGETWTTEELMDADADEERTGEEASSTPFLPFAQTNSVLWVLDTNVLLGLLDALQHVFQRALAAVQSGVLEAPPLYLIVPLIVLEELDNLKHTERLLDHNDAVQQRPVATVGAAARRASRWLLESVQHQKHTRGLYSPAQWVLHVQTQAFTHHQNISLTNDQRIVALSVSMRATHSQVMLVSNDTNARTFAEIEGVLTMDLHALLCALKSLKGKSAEERLWWVCASPEFHYLFSDPHAVRHLTETNWASMYRKAAMLAQENTDIDMDA